MFMFTLHNPKAPCSRLDGSELWQARTYRVRFVARNSATVKPIESPRSQSIVDRLLERVSGVRLDARTLATLRGVARINSLETGVARSCISLFIAECHHTECRGRLASRQGQSCGGLRAPGFSSRSSCMGSSGRFAEYVRPQLVAGDTAICGSFDGNASTRSWVSQCRTATAKRSVAWYLSI